MKVILYLCAALFSICIPFPAHGMTTSEARSHVGEVATVCGQSSGIHTADRARGKPTFINLDGRFPNNAFTILIWGDRAAAFGDLQQFSSGKVCATGKISVFKGKPEIVVYSPKNLEIAK